MILTLTMNPCIDVEVEVRRLVADDINRAVSCKREAGGKGINVSRMVQALGGKTMVIAPFGGHLGMDFLNRFGRTGLRAKLVPISGETRLNVNIRESGANTQTRLNAAGPRLNGRELQQIFDAVERNLPRAAMLIMSGSLPPGVPPETYAEIIRMANKRGVRAILDTDGEPLRRGLKAKPFMVKPNCFEAERIIGKKLTSIDSLVRAAERLRKMGAEVALVSCGAAGAVLASPDGCWQARPPQVKAHRSVGLGDAMTGAFALTLTRGRTMEEALRYGVAAGAACAARENGFGCNRRDVKQLVESVKIKALR